MEPHKAIIERTNRKSVPQVDVQMTVTELSNGRQMWKGEFQSRSADGFLPNEKIAMTLSNGQKGTASISETELNSRTPDVTRILFTGVGPLA
ncbi:MAG: hypothetical protein ABJD11_11595 [Gemmatimonadota bacterium]